MLNFEKDIQQKIKVGKSSIQKSRKSSNKLTTIMKITNPIRIIFTFVIVVLTGCATKCDDFNNEIIDWMPYKKADRIIIGNNNKTDTLIVNYSEIHHTDKIGFGVNCECENSYIIHLSSDSLIINVLFYNANAVERSEILINNEWMNYSERLDRLQINGKEYTDLIIYKNVNETPASRFEKIIISKSIGIISIVGKNELWGIKDDTKRDIDVSKIKLKTIDC